VTVRRWYGRVQGVHIGPKQYFVATDIGNGNTSGTHSWLNPPVQQKRKRRMVAVHFAKCVRQDGPNSPHSQSHQGKRNSTT
jgi:predicted metal-binding protein